MNQPQVFSYRGESFRALQIDGEPWFVLKDVCAAIGIKDHVTVSKRLDEDEVDLAQVIDGMGRSQETTVINESGLYSVILRSDKPEARPFRKWVTSEVLPTIRRTGSYQAKPMTPAEMFAAQAQVNLDYERRLSDLDRRADATETALRNTVRALSVPAFTLEGWQREMQATLNMAVRTYGLNHQTYRGDLYRTLEERAHVDLSSRQTRLRNRLLRQGATTAEVKEVSKLSVIARDPKLREIFHAIFQQDLAQRFSAQPQALRRALPD